MRFMFHRFAAAAMALALLPAASAHAQMPMMPKERLITITASGTVTAAPDQAAVQIGVSSNARAAKDALAANTAKMGPVIDALKAAGIEAKDIQTANFNIQPSYEFTQDGKPPKLTGYTVSNTVAVRVRAVEKLGEILDVAVGQGSNQINGVSFIVSKAEELKDAARKAAVANATRMAKVYAEAAGVTLGDVQTISETSNAREYGPVVVSMAPRARAAGPAPIEAGEETLESQVTMVWAIK